MLDLNEIISHYSSSNTKQIGKIEVNLFELSEEGSND